LLRHTVAHYSALGGDAVEPGEQRPVEALKSGALISAGDDVQQAQGQTDYPGLGGAEPGGQAVSRATLNLFSLFLSSGVHATVSNEGLQKQVRATAGSIFIYDLGGLSETALQRV
jgi:hypothetical protein